MSTPTLVLESATTTDATHKDLQPIMIIFLSIVGGAIVLCILAAIFIPLFARWRRERTAHDARPTDNNEKGSTSNWLSKHDRHMSDGQIPLLKIDSHASMDLAGRKPHYRLASESRPAQPSRDYVLDLYRQSTQDDLSDGEEILEFQKPFVQSLSFPLPSSRLSRELFVIQPDTRSEPQSYTKDQDPVLRNVDAPQQRGGPDAVVSRSSTLSTVSIYSQTSVPSPVQESVSVTPSLTSFPLPPTNVHRYTTVPQLGKTQMDQMMQRSDTTVVGLTA